MGDTKELQFRMSGALIIFLLATTTINLSHCNKKYLVETYDDVHPPKKDKYDYKGKDYGTIGWDTDYSSGGHACLSGESTVETESGEQQISSLVLGDSIATYSKSKGKFFSKFLGWLDRGSEVTRFLNVTTTSGNQMMLTETHLLFVSEKGNTIPKVADRLTLEDTLLVWNGENLVTERIKTLDYIFLEGYRTPLTEEGTLLVDGILTSCYASYDHFWSEIAFAPVKAFPYLLDDENSQYEDGVRSVVKLIKILGRWIGAKLEVNEGRLDKRKTDEVRYTVDTMSTKEEF